jgi:hypothetical protein
MTSSVSSASLLTTTTTAPQLVQLANGEYTAASVSSDESAAMSLGLVKEQDGNDGTTAPSVAAGGTPASQSSSAVQTALASLTLGGT